MKEDEGYLHCKRSVDIMEMLHQFAKREKLTYEELCAAVEFSMDALKRVRFKKCLKKKGNR